MPKQCHLSMSNVQFDATNYVGVSYYCYYVVTNTYFMLFCRFILRVRVQGLVGVVTLTLFDREVTDMLKLSAATLVERCENV